MPITSSENQQHTHKAKSISQVKKKQRVETQNIHTSRNIPESHSGEVTQLGQRNLGKKGREKIYKDSAMMGGRKKGNKHGEGIKYDPNRRAESCARDDRGDTT